MKYVIEISGRTLEVEIDGDRMLLDGRPVDAKLSGGRGSAIRRLERGRSIRNLQAWPGEERGAWMVALAGCRLQVQVMDPRDQAIRAAGSKRGKALGGTLKAPMPGLVLRVMVQEGATVEAGQGLIVVEAMKMENMLKALGPGTVSKIHVQPGARVEKGTSLLDLA